jgi:hypothetical protein
MNRTLSPRERRMVALLILMALFALVYLAVVAPIASGFAARDARREQLLLRYQHNVRTIASIPRLRRQSEQRRAASRAFVLPAHDLESGREALKERLQRAIEAGGGEFREANDGEGEARPGWAQARATASTSLGQLTATLARLQQDQPFLVVDTLTVGADAALTTGRPSALDVQIEASIPIRPGIAR